MIKKIPKIFVLPLIFIMILFLMISVDAACTPHCLPPPTCTWIGCVAENCYNVCVPVGGSCQIQQLVDCNTYHTQCSENNPPCGGGCLAGWRDCNQNMNDGCERTCCLQGEWCNTNSDCCSGLECSGGQCVTPGGGNVCEQPLKDGKPYIYGKTYKQGGYTKLWIAVCGDSDGICPEDFEFYCPDNNRWQTIDCGSFSDPDCEQLQGCSQYNDWVKATIDHRPCTTNLEGCVRDSDGDNFYDQFCQDNEIKPIELVFIA